MTRAAHPGAPLSGGQYEDTRDLDGDGLVGTWCTVRGQPVFARVSTVPVPPDAPSVVMVHGLIVSSRYMLPTAKRLAHRARVYIPDLPGYGHSFKPTQVLDVPGLADALADWMSAMGLPRAVLLGNSFGCQIVIDLAARYPERVERIVLVGPTTDPHARTAHQQIAHWLLNLPGEPLPLGLVVVRDIWDMGARRAIVTFRHMLRDEVAAKLPRIAAPTLVVRGGRDTSVPQRWTEEATRLLPRARLEVIAGAAHTLNYNSPRKLLKLTLPFILGDDPLIRAGSVNSGQASTTGSMSGLAGRHGAGAVPTAAGEGYST